MAQAYPRAALARETDGALLMVCVVTDDGDMTGCSVAGEFPTGLGVGEAGLSLASKFKVGPKDESGRPTAGGIVIIPIRFELPQN